MMWVAIPLDLGLNQSGITTHFAGRLRRVDVTMTIRIPVTNCSCGDSHLQTTPGIRNAFAENLNIATSELTHRGDRRKMQTIGEPTFANAHWLHAKTFSCVSLAKTSRVALVG